MATTANLPQGATPTNGASDPFTATPTPSHSAAMRFAPFDTDQLSLFSTNSPSQAKRALEAHLKDTDRRIQDASRLGTTLLQQRKDLSARLKDVEQVHQDNEVPAELRKKLADLEKEYNEVGKESARAFLPKSRVGSTGDPTATPSALTGSGHESPSKVTAPSRRQRNQPSNRVHDIEFATEISTSLLAQVRQLQGALAEKDDVLKDTASEKAQLEAEAVGMVQRIKHMDESEQRFKDENWNLETRLQELEASHKESTDKEQRVTQSLMATQSEKAAAQRDLDDLKVSHEKLNDEHSVVKRQQETDLHGLRRDAASHETEKRTLQKKIEDLTSQNTELAKAVSYRWNQPSTATDADFVSADEDRQSDDGTPENSEPASPVKGTPRHGMLESETLKSSLNHAHRMIQNLKNNIHREKTEKIELKRMLQDARDELETRRSEGGTVGTARGKKRTSESDSVKFRKPARPDRLGANRSSTTEVMEDEPDWEDHDGTSTPSKSRSVSAAFGGAAVGAAGIATFDHAFGGDDTESTDAAFETATEREGGTTDAFETGREDVGGNDSDELTETEGGVNRTGTVRRDASSQLAGAKARDRRSFQSTASTSAEEDDGIRTPIQAQQPKYRLRMSRSSKRGRVGDLVSDSPSQQSPASSTGTGTPQPAGQSLGEELDALDESSVEGTPSRDVDSAAATPETQRQVSMDPESPEADEEVHEPEIGSPVASHEQPKQETLAHEANAAMLAHEFAIKRHTYADAGVMTDPWEPEKEIQTVKSQGLRQRAGEMVGGALAGFGLGRLGRSKDADEGSEDEQAGAGAEPIIVENKASAVPGSRPTTILETRDLPPEPKTLLTPDLERPPTAKLDSSATLEPSRIISQETEPDSPPRPLNVESQTESGGFTRLAEAAAVPTVPLAAAAPLAVRAHERENFDFSPVVAQDFEPETAPGDSNLALTPILPKRSSKRGDALLATDAASAENRVVGTDGIPGTDSARPGAGFFGHARSQSHSNPPRPRSLVTSDNGSVVEVRTPTGVRSPLGEVPPNTVQRDMSDDSSFGVLPVTKPLHIKRPMADEGSQTVVSGDEIENMLRNKSKAPIVAAGVGAAAFGAVAGAALSDGTSSPSRPSTARRSLDGAVNNEVWTARGPRRPASASSMRNKGVIVPPPLPENYTQKIVAAQQTPGTPSTARAGTMGPPLIPASAYKQNRPQTPAEGRRTMSRDGTTPRPQRASRSSTQVHSPGGASGVSRKTSVSSFASELDERFQIHRGQLMYPDDVQPSTDPRMIQAITQTMIGEYLWKYTRKAGRSGTSTARHRRFFWVHPYTRTLYWSEKDPSTAGRDMLKAKSVAIEAVRVITDDNAYPPGLHRKSLVVVTPGREIVFTAPTGQRHETWFNALSYLLLRTEQEKEAEDTINQEDIDEFNPGFGNSIRRSISRMTGRSQSRVSLSSYNSHTTRNSSPSRAQAGSSLAQRQSAAAARSSKATVTPTPNLAGTSSSRYSTVRESNGGRLSSITSKFRPGSAQRGSYSSARGRSSTMSSRGRSGGSGIYDASVAADSAEDLRAVIESQEQDADRLENVRACCDGKPEHTRSALPYIRT